MAYRKARALKKYWGEYTGACLSFCSMGGGPHVTITHDTLRHGYPLPQRHGTYYPTPPLIPDMGPTPIPTPLLLTSGGHHWRHGTLPPCY